MLGVCSHLFVLSRFWSLCVRQTQVTQSESEFKAVSNRFVLLCCDIFIIKLVMVSFKLIILFYLININHDFILYQAMIFTCVIFERYKSSNLILSDDIN